MKQYEIERRYLLYPCGVRGWLKAWDVVWESVPIRQFYTVVETGRVERYRQVGNRYFFTRKTGQGLKRTEEERPIAACDFEKALAKRTGVMIVKRRYRFELEGRRYELDRFKGALKGLVILETEFADMAEAEAFTLPRPLLAAVAEEVTDLPLYTNGMLAKLGRPPAHGPSAELETNEKKSLKAAVSVRFGPFTPAREAVTLLMEGLAERVARNRKAILAGDEDPERLHQLRVGMRKMRALLSVSGHLFDPVWAEHSKTVLKKLMTPTGPKRDLDVHLAQFSFYRELLPETDRDGLEPLEAFLRREAKEEERRLLHHLNEPAFMEALHGVVDACRGGKAFSSRAGEPVLAVMREPIKNRWRRLCRKGRAIGTDTPAEAYHRLRIGVKKMRYTVEFFAPALEREAASEATAHLKRLQSVLGAHQDLDVQRRFLARLAEKIEMDGQARTALRRLNETMAGLACEKRREFHGVFGALRRQKGLWKRLVCRRGSRK